MHSKNLSEAVAAELFRMLELDEIRRLKLRYAQLLDSLAIDALAELFAEDATCDFGPYGHWVGREAIRQNYREVMTELVGAPFGSLHLLCNHWVELQDDLNATGRSYLIDVMTERRADENPLLHYALYDENYRKIEGRWLISYSCIQFLWPERHTNDAVLGAFPPR